MRPLLGPLPVMSLLATVCAALIPAAPAVAQKGPPAGGPVSTHTLKIPAAAMPTVVLDLGRADVRIRSGAANAIRVYVQTLPGSGGSAPAPDRLVSIHNVAGTVTVVATDAGRMEHGVGITLEVPDRTAVEAKLDRGDIAIHAVVAALSIRTTRGDVRLDAIAGSAVVDVENGSIEAVFRSLDPELPSAFATLNGNVTLNLPRGSRFDLDVRCRGCALDQVDVAARMRTTRLLAPREGDPVIALHGPVGGGGPMLRVFTWNGAVAITTR